ncbi:MAG TPA: hypothetical protein VLQ93_06580 [Myxococcaceae bacterium]|nr:hypothetical protein [Myxococcaceae bacterium]
MLKPASFIILGEMHGTQEAPAFTTRLACHAAAAGQSVRVGLEIPVEEQARIDAFLASEDGATQPLTAGEFWTGAFTDGRSSEAMLQALVRLRELKRSGLPLQVVAFDTGGKGREEGMSEKLRQERAQAPQDTFIVLTGNLHARRTVGTPWDPNRRNMANQLLESEPALVTLDMAYLDGSTWACMGKEVADCKEHSLRAKYAEDAAIPSITLRKDGPDAPYDGVYGVGPVHASPPAAHLKNASEKTTK